MKVSICIPSYNNRDSLKRCIDSIFIQDFNDYEIIITDDSPSDIILQLVSGYNRSEIKYYKNKASLGSPENWNEALSKAKGEYVKIMHHDDWFRGTTSLSSFVALLDSAPDVLFASSGCYDVVEDASKEIKHFVNENDKRKIEQNPLYLLRGNYIGAPSVTIFRNHQKVFFDKKLIWLVDIDFYVRVLNEKSNFVTTPDALVNIGISPSQITRACENNKTLILSEYLYLYEKMGNKKFVHFIILEQLSKYRVFTNRDLSLVLVESTFTLSCSDSYIILLFWLKNQLRSGLRNLKLLKSWLWK